MAKSRLTLMAVIALAMGGVGAGEASAGSLARCHFDARVTFGGSGEQVGDANCAGMIHDSLTGTQGSFRVQNAPAFGKSDTTDITFTVTLKRMLDFSIQGQSDVFGGQLELRRVGSTLFVSGSGSMDQQGLSYAGTGSFDSGQLSLDVTISDGPAPADEPPSDVRCVVPKLHGKSLAGARKALAKAHCKLGKAHRPKGHEHGLVVVSQSVHANATMPAKARVNVRLGKP